MSANRGASNGSNNKKRRQGVDYKRDNVALRQARDGSRSGRRGNKRSVQQQSPPTSRPVEDIKSLDWAKFTHFRARNTIQDLERLCAAGKSNQQSTTTTKHSSVFNSSKPDKAGLWPIHWAAINNRSDMIEFMLTRGAKANKQCRNRLFANGTPLHLAAMNGSLEAAAMLLSKSSSNGNERNQSDGQRGKQNEQKRGDSSRIGTLLNERDADGQTPLMRSAPPRSKRMDTIKDLLRKNFWSLSGRPAEMALYLICNGADWKQTEPINGMNLMHLAIVNDYDDIVSLLLVLDKQLVEVAANVHPRDTTALSSSSREKQSERRDAKLQLAPNDDFKTISLRRSEEKDTKLVAKNSTKDSDSSSSASSSTSLAMQREPLMSSRDKANEIVAKGLKPLHLAILYGRVRIISLLWHAKLRNPNLATGGREQDEDQIINECDNNLGKQRRAVREHSNSSKELKRILVRACWSNRDELAKFLKSTILKGALIIDLALLALLWAPIYAATNQDGSSILLNLKGGVFLISYCVTMAIVFRAMLKNPGYLRRNSVQYLAELSKLTAISRNNQVNSTSKQATLENKGIQTGAANSRITIVQPQQWSPSSPSGQSAPLIRLHSPSPTEDKTEALDEARPSPLAATPENVNSGKPNETALPPPPPPQLPLPDKAIETSTEKRANKLVVLPQAPNWQAQFDLKDTVRLLCHKCQCIRRPRSRHCDHCNHCVQDFDHHCIYLGCCIGRHNRLDFLLALIALSITSIYGTIIHSISPVIHSNWSSFWHLLAFFWVFKYALIGAWSSFQNLRRACLGVTLYEEIRSKRIRHLFGRYGPPESISKSHRGLSTLKGSYWRYAPDRFITGELGAHKIWANYREFANFISVDEYLLTYICTDTPLARSITSSDARINLYKIA